MFNFMLNVLLKVWKESTAANGRTQAKYSEVATFESSDEVSALAVHPLGNFINFKYLLVFFGNFVVVAAATFD